MVSTCGVDAIHLTLLSLLCQPRLTTVVRCVYSLQTAFDVVIGHLGFLGQVKRHIPTLNMNKSVD